MESSPGTEQEKGFGIGLQHIRDLVRRSGGTIRLESSRGEGSVFTVRLPLYQQHE